jgi:hypothetical protein
MYLVKEDISFLIAGIRFIEWFLKEKAWWWLVISQNLSPNQFIYDVMYDCMLENIYIYIYTVFNQQNNGDESP